MIDFNNSSKAIYLQIADDICDKILTGTFVPDERIPSVREYAAQVEVNVNTVMRAYDYLSSLNKRGLGFFAATDARLRVIDQRRRELLGDTAVNFFRQLDMLDITPARLADMYQQYLDNKK